MPPQVVIAARWSVLLFLFRKNPVQHLASLDLTVHMPARAHVMY